MSDNYNIEALRNVMDLINENKDKLTDEQKIELEKSGNSVDEVEAAFKEYDLLVASLPEQIKKAFK